MICVYGACSEQAVYKATLENSGTGLKQTYSCVDHLGPAVKQIGQGVSQLLVRVEPA